MATRYVPDAGDIVWMQFSPQAGHEQATHRPALVISASHYNSKVGLMLCCPMTTQIKGYPFEVSIAGTPPCVVLADQLKNMDWTVRQATHKGKVTPGELAEVRAKIRTLVG